MTPSGRARLSRLRLLVPRAALTATAAVVAFAFIRYFDASVVINLLSAAWLC